MSISSSFPSMIVAVRLVKLPSCDLESCCYEHVDLAYNGKSMILSWIPCITKPLASSIISEKVSIP